MGVRACVGVGGWVGGRAGGWVGGRGGRGRSERAGSWVGGWVGV